jgi:NAD(P)-dependent dehydrogenase (short-subunit alcohol dehydrogenase family)
LSLVFARAGAKLVLLARNEERLNAVYREVTAIGAPALSIQADITQDADCQRILEKTLSTFGRADALINNAFQLGPRGPLATAVLDGGWKAPLMTNLMGSLQLTQAVVPALAESRGCIVMINTIAIREVRPSFSSYAISKGALQTATRYLAQELAPRGIRVNTVVPGYIDGPPLREAFAAMADTQGIAAADVADQVRAELPLRIIPTGEDVAQAALFLASDYARAITGASLDVNAGEYIAA